MVECVWGACKRAGSRVSTPDSGLLLTPLPSPLGMLAARPASAGRGGAGRGEVAGRGAGRGGRGAGRGPRPAPRGDDAPAFDAESAPAGEKLPRRFDARSLGAACAPAL
jgi:hypothetical protein